MDREEMLTRRLMATNENLLKALEALDPSDPDYWKNLKTIEALHSSVVRDVELELSDRQKDKEIDVEYERNAIEERKIAESERANRKGEKLEISKQVVLVGTSLLSFFGGWKMFNRATKKEADEAILTTTDQTVVKSGLGGIFKGFNFGNKNNLLN